MLQSRLIDSSPKNLFASSPAPRGPVPPPSIVENSSETQRVVGVSLLQDTFRRVNTARINGVGGRIDMMF